MSEEVDFIISDIKTIERPPNPVKNSAPPPNKNPSKPKTFEIQKSFVQQPVSQVHEQLRPELEKLKMFLKSKKQKQRKMKEMLANGSITREQFEGVDREKERKKQEEAPTEKLTIDSSGQLRDQKGNLIFVKAQTSELKINQKKDHQQIAKELSKKQKIKFHEKLSKNLLDRNLVVSGSKKKTRRSLLGLQFLEKGSYQSYSARPKKQITDLEDVLKSEQEEHRAIKKRQKTKLEFNRDVPVCEWWDKEILSQAGLKAMQEASKQEPSSSKIEWKFEDFLDQQKLCRQVVYQKVGDEKRQPKVSIPVYLTKDERKKLKRKRKREKLLEKNDMIKLGLIEPDKPKLKLSNMTVVMKDQFVMDPSRVEAEAKKQQEERLNKHLETNQSRKLTKNQKKDKVIRKLKRDSAKQCRRIVFRLEKLENPSHIFKVNMNAKQLALNGFVMKPNEFHRQPVLVVAEGGQKAIRFFKNLMMNRIDWKSQQGNKCKLVWEGQIESSKIGKWKTYEVADESETVRTLIERGVQNFGQYLT